MADNWCFFHSFPVVQLLRRSRDVPTANMNLDVIVKRIDRDMDRRLDAHRHRQDSLQEGILERSSSYPLIPALEQVRLAGLNCKV